MKRTVRVLRRAQADLIDIQAYVVRDNPAAAEDLIGGILSLMQTLEAFPERGARPKDPHLRQAGYRFVTHGEYLIFYKVLRAQVRVYRVLHGRRRYEDLL